MMSEWKQWTVRKWNERLLDHFFRSEENKGSPVVNLLVTAEELARATGDPEADPQSVRESFVTTLLDDVRGRNLLGDAHESIGWAGLPRFLAHLVLTCIAASESSDDLADENSFIVRLRALTGDRLPDASLQLLPQIWKALEDWLKEHEESYRPLILPDPGAFTRIGYTVKLAFPDRRDQRELSDLLDRGGLAGQEPPVGHVLSLIGKDRNRFRSSFLLAFDDFRYQFLAGGGRWMPQLARHRFWAAVREAALRGRGLEEVIESPVRLSLLAEEEDDRIVLFVVAQNWAESESANFVELPIPYGPWQFTLLPKGADEINAENLNATVLQILRAGVRLPKISSYVQQGVLSFVAAPHGLLELAAEDQLEDVCVALVRDDLHDDILKIARGPLTSSRRSCYEGWTQIHSPRFAGVPSSSLEGTSLARTWVLHQSLTPTSTRLVRGIRVDGGWLGMGEVLPEVIAPSATRVVATNGNLEISLAHVMGDTWVFPKVDLAGDYMLVISASDFEERRRVRFSEAPASESYRPPADPNAWIVEEVAGTGTLSTSPPETDRISAEDYAEFWERAAYLGSDVGRFVDSAESAAWTVIHFAARYIGTTASGALPTTQVADPHARRRWRKLLFAGSSADSGQRFDHVRRRARSSVLDESLPKVASDQTVPTITPSRLAVPSTRTNRLIHIVAGRASARSGMPWREWSDFVQRVLGVDLRIREQVTRAWMEAGLIDIVSHARWRHRAVFARPPHLVAFKSGDSFGAALSGLVLPATLEQVRRVARANRVLVEDRFSVSEWVPQTLALRAAEQSNLRSVANACHLSLRWMDLTLLFQMDSARHDGTTDPPGHYQHSTRWSQWSLKQGDFSDVQVDHYMRPDRPDYWIASRGEKRVWSYDLNITRAWAAALRGDPIVNISSGSLLTAHHAFLPLPIARAVSVLGGGLSGPLESDYRYPLANTRLTAFVVDLLAKRFDVSRVTKGVARTE